jgi:hypothetical protein
MIWVSGFVVFAAFCGGTAGVEKSAGRRKRSPGRIQPGEQPFQDVLGFAVRGCLARSGSVSSIRHAFGLVRKDLAVEERRKRLTPCSSALWSRLSPLVTLSARSEKRFLHGFADQGVRGEVHDGLWPVRGQGGVDGGSVFEIASDKGGFWVDGGAVALEQVVEDHDLIPARISCSTVMLPM